MADEPVKEILLDLRGQICPSTLLVALREMNALRSELKAKTVRIIILTTNRDSTVTIPGAAANMGYEVSVETEEDAYRIVIGLHGD